MGPMKRVLRVLFLMFAFVACVQLTGVEQAFCADSAAEAGCEDCMTCAGHQLTCVEAAYTLTAGAFCGDSFASYDFYPIENPPLGFFRPPIVR